jgi:hypothetical protein
MVKSDKNKENTVKKYFGSCLIFLRPNIKDPDYSIIFARKGNDYVLATSRGEEFPISCETLDKVRDIASCNMDGLTEYEEKFFKRFKYEDLLKEMVEESMYRHLEKEGFDRKDIAFQLFISDWMLNPSFMMPLRENPTKEEAKIMAKRKEEIENYFKDKFGVNINADDSTFTNLLIKLSSDKSYQRKKFLKEALKKKKE